MKKINLTLIVILMTLFVQAQHNYIVNNTI